MKFDGINYSRGGGGGGGGKGTTLNATILKFQYPVGGLELYNTADNSRNIDRVPRIIKNSDVTVL